MVILWAVVEQSLIFVCRHRVAKCTCLSQATWGDRVRFSHRLLDGVGGGALERVLDGEGDF